MSEPLRILFLTTTDAQAATFLRSWFVRLSEQDTEVSLATTVNDFRDELEETGAQVLDVNIGERPHASQDMATVIDLVYLIGRLRPDVVHTHSVRAGFLGRLAAWMCGVPVVIHTVRSLPANDTAWGLEWMAARWCHHLVAVSERDLEQLARRIAPRRKLSLIRDGISARDFQPREGARERVRSELGLTDEPLVGMVVEPESPLPARLLAAHPRLQVARLGLEEASDGRLHDVPWDRSGPDALAAVDLFVLNSDHRELHPLLLGVMLLGIPVVSTVPTEVLRGGVDGLICSEAELGETVAFLLDRPEERARLGAAARQRAAESYDDEDSKARMWSLYHNLCARRRAQAS